MRTLKYAILGLLNKKAMTGYDIAKEFNYELIKFWYARHSQIYPELKRLAEEELVTFDIQISGDILEKKLYTITEKGKKELLVWLHKDEIMSRTPKDVFRLRMYFSNNLDLDSRIHLLENQKMQHLERLSVLKKTAEQYPEVPDHNSDRFGDFIVLDGAIMREESAIKWFDKCISLCKKAKKEEKNNSI